MIQPQFHMVYSKRLLFTLTFILFSLSLSASETALKVGLFGIGLDTYWGQFDGLQKRLEGYQNEISTKISGFGCKVVNAGLVDNPQKSAAAASLLKSNEVDIIFIYVSTYALSSTVLPIVKHLDVPFIILNLQPTASIDYKYVNSLVDRGKMTGEWLANCQACSVPELSCVFNRAEVKYDIVTGYLQEDSVWTNISEWLAAAKAVKGMRNNRMGILGHYYCGMLDVYTDLRQQSTTFGTHIELLEMCELAKLRSKVTPKEVNEKINEMRQVFNVDSKCEDYELRRAAQTSVALDKLVEKHNLGSIAYYYEGEDGNEYENIVTSVIAGNTILTSKDIPVAGECEVKNVQAMKILSLLGAGGSFSEPYAMDFVDDVVLWGHDGPGHPALSQEKVRLVPLPLYHGKPGKGLSIQMTVKTGPVTLLSVCEGKDGIFLLVAEGESVKGDILQIGNTNSRYRFKCGAKEFMNRWSKAGPSHHCAIGIGHVAGTIEKMAALLNIKVVKIN